MNNRIWIIVALLALAGGLALRNFYKPQIGGNAPVEAQPPRPYRPNVAEGDKAPAIELADLGGKKRSLKYFWGQKPVLIWFFAPT